MSQAELEVVKSPIFSQVPPRQGFQATMRGPQKAEIDDDIQTYYKNRRNFMADMPLSKDKKDPYQVPKFGLVTKAEKEALINSRQGDKQKDGSAYQ